MRAGARWRARPDCPKRRLRVRLPGANAGDRGVCGHGDRIERVMQRRDGRPGRRRVSVADAAQLAYRPAAQPPLNGRAQPATPSVAAPITPKASARRA
jgi:hypothetical protein